VSYPPSDNLWTPQKREEGREKEMMSSPSPFLLHLLLLVPTGAQDFRDTTVVRRG